MARPGWLEHPTYCFVGSRSIHLSYGRAITYGWPLFPCCSRSESRPLLNPITSWNTCKCSPSNRVVRTERSCLGVGFGFVFLGSLQRIPHLLHDPRHAVLSFLAPLGVMLPGDCRSDPPDIGQVLNRSPILPETWLPESSAPPGAELRPYPSAREMVWPGFLTSPGGALDSSPRRKPWVRKRETSEPRRGERNSAWTDRSVEFFRPCRGLWDETLRSPGLRPGLDSSAPPAL